MVCCPLTSQIKAYPFEVVIAGAPPSAVLADQVKSLDWRKRRARRRGTVSRAELADVRAKTRALIGRSVEFFSMAKRFRFVVLSGFILMRPSRIAHDF
jgi:hypothetical protein